MTATAILAPVRETESAVTVCGACAGTLAPDGKCYAVGACADADATATAGASRQTAKYAVPAAWNVRGGVD